MVAASSFLSLKGRVARVLLDLAEEFGREVGQGRVLIQQKVSQEDLAAMAGIARENVSRILHDWTKQALLSRLSGYYCLENNALLPGRTRPPHTKDIAPKAQCPQGLIFLRLLLWSDI